MFSILASISDHNLPVQADGYTQTLQEFDKIYLQLNIKNHSIIRAGHLDLNDETTYFGRYQRRSMGLQFLAIGKNGNKTSVDVSGGVAQVSFSGCVFKVLKVIKRLYRLTGKNGELFITIISGSEQVYIDGILMKRGENQDYISNYNTGEIAASRVLEPDLFSRTSSTYLIITPAKELHQILNHRKYQTST